MGVWRVEIDDGVLIRLGWLVAALCARRTVSVDPPSIRSVDIVPRGELEPLIENRVLGIGTSIGRRWRGRTRVGRFLGRPVVGEQFWAVPPGDREAMPLVVVDCDPSSAVFARVVLGVADPAGAAARLTGSTAP